MRAVKTSQLRKALNTPSPTLPGRSSLSRRLLRPAVLLSLLIGVVWLFNEEKKFRGTINEDDQKITMSVGSGTDRCLDPDDPAEWKKIPTKQNCQCPDPLQPSKRMTPSWKAHHQVLVQDAEYAAIQELEDGHKLDVVLLGDSITERWNGTRNMGQTQRPENRAVFNRFFDKISVSSAPLQGLALGSAGDITTELLWHLQNGMLPDQLQPKVWLLLIGTNDLGRSGCSKSTTLKGILQVAQYLHEKRPGTPLLLHGLLPRNEGHEKDFTLNRYWRDILWINRELKKFCSLHSNWYYMEASNLFLQRINDADHPDGDAQGTVMINKDVMLDALHPSVVGYEVWGHRIVEEVLKLIPN